MDKRVTFDGDLKDIDSGIDETTSAVATVPGQQLSIYGQRDDSAIISDCIIGIALVHLLAHGRRQGAIEEKSIKIGSPAVGGLLSGSSSSGRGGRCFDPVSAYLVPVYLVGTAFGLVAGQTLVRQDPNVHRVQLDHAAAGDSFAA